MILLIALLTTAESIVRQDRTSEKIALYISMKMFKEKVLRVVKAIPKGTVLTYKEVARRAGSPGAYRAVGNILNGNRNPKIPCHRVIRSDSTVGGYNGGREKKVIILRREGAIIKINKSLI